MSDQNSQARRRKPRHPKTVERNSQPRRHTDSRQRPSQRARSTDSARLAAWQILEQVRTKDGYANLISPKILRQARLQGRDAGFAIELAYGTLRLQSRYDAIIAHCLDRKDIDPEVRDILRLGAHQLLGMRVPPHAAVSETVALARQVVGVGASQLVNAVLRRISEKDLAQWLTILREEAPTSLAALSVEYSHPEWIVRSLQQSLAWYKKSGDELAELLHAHNEAAPVTLVARPGLVADAELPDTTPARYAPTARILAGGDPGSLEAVRDGRAGVQDEGSQLVALAAAHAPVEGSDHTWLDLCAGPGGKTALLASLLHQRDPHGVLVANEVTAHRAELVAKAVTNSPLEVTVQVGDGREVAGSFDRVLVDAPCTGLGALRRRPEARWRRTPQDLAHLGVLQRELLSQAIAVTRPGGVVAYVTCSPHLAETVLVVEDVMKKNSHVSLIDAATVVNEVSQNPLPDVTGPYVQLWTHQHQTDGMFLALLRVGNESR